ncbi:hypothetical protein vseg_014296 [Gypsophila vaccaria]
MSDVNPCFPDDTWIEILKCLPVKTLGICRCVCKSWHSLVISETFMSSHLKHYTQNQANSLLLHKGKSSKCFTDREYEECTIYLDSAKLIQGNSLHTSVFPFILSDAWWPSFQLAGSVHGLLCLFDDSCVFVWNPLLKKCVKLPASTSTEENPVLGFGFDATKNDHRVVKISCCRGKDESTTTPPSVEVYSVQKRTWKIICSDFFINNSFHDISTTHCFLNGAIHWLTHEPKVGFSSPISKHLLLFNIVEETFDKMELPEDILEMRTGYFGIFEHQRKLAVSLCDYQCWEFEISFRCQIWIKQDYNVEDSWRRILNVGC